MPRKPDPRVVEFFYKHAGYSWNKAAGQSKEAGHRESATALALAEDEARARGWRVTWEHDVDPDMSGIEDAKEVLSAVLTDENGKVLASLGGIADPDRNYGRVVEAELAVEAIGGR
jgi:hypothetical protein